MIQSIAIVCVGGMNVLELCSHFPGKIYLIAWKIGIKLFSSQKLIEFCVFI